MTVRVTQSMIFRQTLTAIQRNLRDLQRAQSEATTGVKIQRPSDDPALANQAMRLRAERDRIGQFLANIDEAQDLLDTGASALEEFSGALTELRTTLLRAATGTTADEDRPSLAVEVAQTLGLLTSLANQQLGGRTLFGGTGGSRSPYEREEEGGAIAAVRYADNTGTTVTEVGPGVRIQTRIPGPELFSDPLEEGRDIFGLLIEIRDHLTDVEDVPNAELGDRIRERLESFDRIHDRVLTGAGILGARSARVQSLRDHLSQVEALTEITLGEKEGADLVETITLIGQRQQTLQAIGAMTRTLFDTSLLEFLT